MPLSTKLSMSTASLHQYLVCCHTGDHRVREVGLGDRNFSTLRIKLRSIISDWCPFCNSSYDLWSKLLSTLLSINPIIEKHLLYNFVICQIYLSFIRQIIFIWQCNNWIISTKTELAQYVWHKYVCRLFTKLPPIKNEYVFIIFAPHKTRTWYYLHKDPRVAA